MRKYFWIYLHCSNLVVRIHLSFQIITILMLDFICCQHYVPSGYRFGRSCILQKTMWSSVCFWKVPPNTSHNIERLCRMMCCEIVIRDLLRIRLAYKEIQSSSQFTYSSTCIPLTAAIMRIVASIIYAKQLVLSTNRMFGLQGGMVYEDQFQLYNIYTYRKQN